MTNIEIRQLWPPFRWVVIDHGLRHPLIGVAATNGRIIWGRRRAEDFAAWYQRDDHPGERWHG